MSRSLIPVIFLVFLAAALPAARAQANSDAQSEKKRYAIAIHGGAGSAPSRFGDEANAKRSASMRKALEIGAEILKSGGSSLDAVEAVVRFLEDDPQFNAGRGAVFNAVGGHELDASIMDGRNLACGAVAGITTVKNPISLARKVMTETRHVLLAGTGADAFAREQKVELVEPSYFHTEAARKEWEERQARRKSQSSTASKSSYIVKGTVGCVALDRAGNLAAATSTGGLTNKKFGRVGDSPIVGAGTYADNETCAVSYAGVGEEFIRRAIAYDLSAQMRYAKIPIDRAAREILTGRLAKGMGGIIAVDREGAITMQFNTSGMPRAAADSTGRFEVLWSESENP